MPTSDEGVVVLPKDYQLRLMADRPGAEVAAETAERLAELADVAELMGDGDGAARLRSRAAVASDRAMRPARRLSVAVRRPQSSGAGELRPTTGAKLSISSPPTIT